mmetsp:Transcript_29859/g.69453  ORF Transcript_29859/g.69453 Transcript_29859/m.69453 type:complete len:220 (+) Transcript_29859:1648-2307(+)
MRESMVTSTATYDVSDSNASTLADKSKGTGGRGGGGHGTLEIKFMPPMTCGAMHGAGGRIDLVKPVATTGSLGMSTSGLTPLRAPKPSVAAEALGRQANASCAAPAYKVAVARGKFGSCPVEGLDLSTGAGLTVSSGRVVETYGCVLRALAVKISSGGTTLLPTGGAVSRGAGGGAPVHSKPPSKASGMPLRFRSMPVTVTEAIGDAPTLTPDAIVVLE